MIMSPDPQALNQQDETFGGVSSGQFYVRAVRTGANVGDVPSDQFSANPAGTGMGAAPTENSSASKSQSQGSPASKGMNKGLNKALIGGLLGATLGTLAAALANKRTAEGASHAAKGVGKAVKSVAEGANQAAKGVGEAVKTVTEGVNHAVVGSVVDALKDTAEGAKKSVEGAADELKQSADYANRSGGYVNQGGYVNPADQQFDSQTTYVLIPVEKERVIERTIIVEPTMPVDSGAGDITPEEILQQMSDSEQTSEFDQQTSEFDQQTSGY